MKTIKTIKYKINFYKLYFKKKTLQKKLQQAFTTNKMHKLLYNTNSKVCITL